MSSLIGRKVTVIGLGREGLAVTRVLAREGAEVAVGDTRDAAALAREVGMLEGLGVALSLGGYSCYDMLDCDLLVLSPGVDKRAKLVQEALRRGIRVSSETELFLERCPAPVVGVTGSAGKTTTTTMLGVMLREGLELSGKRIFVGGNIGQPLLERLPEIDAASVVVLELSSFQLEWLRISPTVAVVTNVTPNHLDRHETMDAYIAAKAQVVRHQRDGDVAILNADEPNAASLSRYAPGRVLYFSLSGDREIPDGTIGAYFDGDRLFLRQNQHAMTVCRAVELGVPGLHNVANALAAAIAASCCGVDAPAIGAAVRAFRGVPHRLEPIATIDGVTYIDDSIATAPERTLAALASLDRPAVLILGGRDKHLPWDALAETAVRRCRGAVLIGEAAPLIRRHLESALAAPESGTGLLLSKEAVLDATSMASAVDCAARLAHPGDAIVLAPGCASFDMYRDFEERGDAYVREVRRMQGDV